MHTGHQARNNTTQPCPNCEIAKKDLTTTRNELNDVMQNYRTVLEDIETDPKNLYHPIYKRMDDLRQVIKQLEQENTYLQVRLYEARLVSWDRRESMVVCPNPK